MAHPPLPLSHETTFLFCPEVEIKGSPLSPVWEGEEEGVWLLHASLLIPVPSLTNQSLPGQEMRKASAPSSEKTQRQGYSGKHFASTGLAFNSVLFLSFADGQSNKPEPWITKPNFIVFSLLTPPHYSGPKMLPSARQQSALLRKTDD